MTAATSNCRAVLTAPRSMRSSRVLAYTLKYGARRVPRRPRSRSRSRATTTSVYVSATRSGHLSTLWPRTTLDMVDPITATRPFAAAALCHTHPPTGAPTQAHRHPNPGVRIPRLHRCIRVHHHPRILEALHCRPGVPIPPRFLVALHRRPEAPIPPHFLHRTQARHNHLQRQEAHTQARHRRFRTLHLQRRRVFILVHP
jgi:hypothetical protein